MEIEAISQVAIGYKDEVIIIIPPSKKLAEPGQKHYNSW
jgi:hypothetical protein